MNLQPKTPSISSASDNSYVRKTNHSHIDENYTIIREIGHGSQGYVYLAERKSDNKQVVIKQLNIASIKNWKSYDLFNREAKALASLDIDGIAKFYEAFECLNEEPPCAYIVQEYIPAQSLDKLIKSGHHFDFDTIYDIIIQLLKIIDKLHHHNPPIIHRDIKPSNILLANTGLSYKAYLIDFGAVANPQVQGGGSTVAGTYGYMPPEQLMGKPDPASDIYALAAVIVYIISGKSPADMPVKDFHLIFEHEMPNAPQALIATMNQMLAPNVSQRLTDTNQLIDFFSELKNNNASEVSLKKLFSTKDAPQNSEIREYYKNLLEVSDFNQPGSIDLFKRFPDSGISKNAALFSMIDWFTDLTHDDNTDINISDYSSQTDKKNEPVDFKATLITNFAIFLIFIILTFCVGLSKGYTTQPAELIIYSFVFTIITSIVGVLTSELLIKRDGTKAFGLIVVTIAAILSLIGIGVVSMLSAFASTGLSGSYSLPTHFMSITFWFALFSPFIGCIYILIRKFFADFLSNNNSKTVVKTYKTVFNLNKHIPFSPSRAFLEPYALNERIIDEIYSLSNGEIFEGKDNALTNHELFIPYAIKYLLRHGHKAFAVITSVKYLMTESCNLETNYNTLHKTNRSFKDSVPFSCHQHPTFEVRYQFTLPNSDRVIHTSFVTEVKQQLYCKVGDTLPILYMDFDYRNNPSAPSLDNYLAMQNQTQRSRVMCMPFPFVYSNARYLISFI